MSRVRRAPRPWSITPVPGGSLDELVIVREIEDENLGLTLWRAVRDVRLWADAPRDLRGEMLRPPTPEVRARHARAAEAVEAMEDENAPLLTAALGVFSSLLEEPGEASVVALADACAAVAIWAEKSKPLNTRRTAGLEIAQVFADAAATVAPEVPLHANRAARISRRVADHGRAQVWYERAIALARRGRDSEQYIRGNLGLALVEKERLRFSRAKQHLVRGARRAEALGRRALAAQVQHDLLVLAAAAMPFDAALRHAARALHNYPIRHPSVPTLAADFGWVLTKHGLFEPAAFLLRKAAPLIASPSIRAYVWATFARAATGAMRYEEAAEAAALCLTETTDRHEFAAESLVHLAEAARLRHRWEEARAHCTRALHIAAARQSREVERVAHQLLHAIDQQDRTWPEGIPSQIGRITTVVRDFDSRLRRWRGPICSGYGQPVKLPEPIPNPPNDVSEHGGGEPSSVRSPLPIT